MLTKSICRECNLQAGQGWNNHDEMNWENHKVFCIREVLKFKGMTKITKIPDDCLFHLEQIMAGQDDVK